MRLATRSESTRTARSLLLQHGVPSTSGKAHGMAWVDLVAWGCVPIEAKLSNEYDRPGSYHWNFSPRQYRRGLRNQLLMLMACPKNGPARVFIIPPSTPKLFDVDGIPFRWGIYATLESSHHQSVGWQIIKPYENRFDLIEVWRQEWSIGQLRAHTRAYA